MALLVAPWAAGCGGARGSAARSGAPTAVGQAAPEAPPGSAGPAGGAGGGEPAGGGPLLSSAFGGRRSAVVLVDLDTGKVAEPRDLGELPEEATREGESTTVRGLASIDSVVFAGDTGVLVTGSSDATALVWGAIGR